MSEEILRGIIPIEKKFLQRNFLFALDFREGFVFGRVVRRRICQYAPWPLIDTEGNTVDIPADSVSPAAEIRFRDPRNPADDLLYLDTTTNAGLPWILHGAFGIKPQQINMYLRYPEGQVIPGKFPKMNPIRPAVGDDISPLNELVSPYDQPTDYHEVVIQPTVHLGAEFFNKDEKRNHQPVLNILFCIYWFQIFKPDIHAKHISDIALRRYEGAKAAFLQMGFGDQSHDIGPQLQKDWRVTPLSLDEAAALSGGR